MSTCTLLLFEVGPLRGAVVVDVGASKRSGKKGQSRRTEKKMKGDKSGGGGPGNGEKWRREGEQEEGEFCLSSETMETTGVQLQSIWSNGRGRTEKFLFRWQRVVLSCFCCYADGG